MVVLPKKKRQPTQQEQIVRQNAMTRAVEILSASAMAIDFADEKSYISYMNKLFLVAEAIEHDYHREVLE